MLGLFHSDIIGFCYITGDAESQLLRLGFVAVLFLGKTAVQVVGALALFHGHEDRHIGVFVLCGKINSLCAGGAWQPDGRRLLDGARPDIDIAVIVVLTLERKRARTCPGLNDQVVGFVHTLAAEGRIDVIAEVLHACAAYEAGDDAPAAEYVEHSNLFSDA